MSNGSDPTRQISQMPYNLVSRTNKPGFRAWSCTNKPVLASIEGEYPTFVAKGIWMRKGPVIVDLDEDALQGPGGKHKGLGMKEE